MSQTNEFVHNSDLNLLLVFVTPDEKEPEHLTESDHSKCTNLERSVINNWWIEANFTVHQP